MNDGSAFEKRSRLLAMLDDGVVMVHLDPRPDSVIVPPYLKHDPVLRLNLAYGYRLPALDIGAHGIYAVLSFNKHNFGCTLPWEHIFAFTAPESEHNGVAWLESAPREVQETLAAAAAREADLSEDSTDGDLGEFSEDSEQSENSGGPPPADTPPIFTVLEGGRARDDDDDDAPRPAAPPRPRPHLSLVKD